MKRKITTLLGLFFGLGISSMAQIANVQVVHNSPDPALDSVDVFVNGTETLSNVTYRSASEFLTVPTLDDVVVGIAPASESNTYADTVKTFSFDLAAGENYYIIADGLIGESFDLYDYEGARMMATSGTANTDFIVYHGSINAPAVDIYAEEADANIVEDLSFGMFSDFLELPAVDYNVQVRDENSTMTVAGFEVPFESVEAEGQALLVMASGYLNPIEDQPEFGLFAVLTDGTVVELDMSTARAQIIHNSPIAGEVDIWVNNTLTLEDIEYRSATEFLDLPVGLNQMIAVTAAGSNDTAGAAIQASFDLMGMDSYYIIADGDVATQDLGLYVETGAKEEATDEMNTDFQIYHGGIDASAVDVYLEENDMNLADDLDFGMFSDYIEAETADYNVQVRDEASLMTVNGYSAPFETLGLEGGALLVVASGYLSPINDQPTFELLAVLPNGEVIELPVSTSRVQIIHNSPVADSVDIWINNELALENVKYRTATGYMGFPVGLNQMIAVTAPGSEDTVDAVIQASIDVLASANYVIVADGDGTNQPLGLYGAEGTREEATSGENNTDVLVYHGGTNAPAVNVDATGVGNLIEDLSFGDFANYLELATADYSLEIRANSDNSLVEDYSAPLATLELEGQSIVVMASGYLSPVDDQPAFGLFAVLDDGTVMELSPITGLVETFEEAGVSVYPNPVVSSLNIEQDEFQNIMIVDMTGNTVYQGAAVETLNVSTLNAGVYFMTLSNNSKSVTGKLVIE